MTTALRLPGVRFGDERLPCCHGEPRIKVAGFSFFFCRTSALVSAVTLIALFGSNRRTPPGPWHTRQHSRTRRLLIPANVVLKFGVWATKR